MTVITSYPGVYLSEDARPGFSVSNAATAVPVFIHDQSLGDDIQSFHSWAAFSEKFKEAPDQLFYHSIKLWFMHGGGKCYLAHENKVYEAVSENDDITLFIQTGRKNSVFPIFNQLISEGHRIFGLFDGQEKQITNMDKPDEVMKDYPATSHAAVFYPWVNHSASTAPMPASAVAAASIACSDRQRGVWKAPANQPITGVTPQYPVSDDLQGLYNKGKALNMIRTFSDTGTVVWGSRTLEDSDNWRYIPVRRLFNTVETDIKNAMEQIVFEPNNQPIWQRIKVTINNYLHRLWEQGALAGNTPGEAWFVQVGKGVTMNETDINQGKMIVKIGLAAVRPAEFVILQFSQDVAR